MRSLAFASSAIATAAIASPLAFAHFDVSVDFHDSRITTGGIDVDTLDFTPDLRIFAGDLGEFPAPPGFGDEPGFFSTTLTPGASIGFDIVDDLRTWDGADFDALAPETLSITKGSNTIIAPNIGGGFAPGFSFAVADGEGHIHEHMDLELTPHAASGVYLVAYRLWTDAPGIVDSLPFWVVLNNGADEEVHDAAIAWADTHLVPAPAGGSIGLLGITLSTRCRRRR